MSTRAVMAKKPKALRKGSRIAVIAPASPAQEAEWVAGIAELQRIGYRVKAVEKQNPDSYFAATTKERLAQLEAALTSKEEDALIAMRGGYGSNYLLASNLYSLLTEPKCLIGFSDLTSLQTYLWQCGGWVTFYGPMVAAGFNRGPNAASGYDPESFSQAVSNSKSGWKISLQGESLAEGSAEGRVVGGCLTLLQTTLATPWEFDSTGSILLLEDRGMKPYQVDRALMHLKQAAKFDAVKGIILGDFPDTPVKSTAGAAKAGTTIREVCQRILSPLGIPIVYGSPVGHTERAMLTIPLGVHAKLNSSGDGVLEILEPAVAD
jgi:muramoyltetrapeptide carboxypeptidase